MEGRMIKIINVGKLKDKALRLLVEEYEKRLRAFTKLDRIEVAEEVAPQRNSVAQNEIAKEKEGERLLANIQDREFVILLDLWGEMVSSEKLSEKIAYIQTYKKSHLTFVIAGSLGHGQNIYKRSDYRWKLSDLTFTHQMTLVLVLEQLYRSYTIQQHAPYHK